MLFCGCASNSQDSPKASQRVIFKWKKLIQQLNLLLEWVLKERWRRPRVLSWTCLHVATLQFDRCAEKDSLCGTGMMAWICRATNFTQTPKKNKNEVCNCHLAMLGRVAKPIFTSLCPGQPSRVWVCWGSKSGTAWEPLAISRPSLRGPQPRDVDALACAKEL